MRLARQQPIQATPADTPPVSVTRNRFLSLPPGLSQIGPRESDPPSSFGEPAGGTGSGSSESTTVIKNENNDGSNASNKVEPPPPVVRRTKSIGVANGYATYLPKPLYPSNALTMGVVGKVDVQITIDEKGTVISAKAASGHIFLRSAAENAAWKAKFKPTTLDGAPVKVTGVIVYNFMRN
jgi:TonB family protein